MRSIPSLDRCITCYEELMLMKEFERTENELENKVTEAQKRFDAEQMKVTKIISLEFYSLFGYLGR